MSNISNIRKDYLQQSLTEDTIAPDPIRQFDVWWAAALQAKLDEVNAMTLATASADGIPSARIVLLKGYDERGFVFFTNYQSEKGQDLIANPHASLVFFWPTLERQVRINGSAEKVSSAESDEYFNSRPVGSRIGAWASPQSEVIKSRDLLEQNVTELERKYADGSIPRPPHWGGFRIIPNSIEFWQGRPNRLHDRIRYTLIGEEWVIERLAP